MKGKTRAPLLSSESEDLASLLAKQERHERLAQKHAASAKRVWLRRVLLELSQEKAKKNGRARKKASRRNRAGK